jgi:hypothetical protein
MSKPNAHQIDRNEAAADVYEAMKAVEAALYVRMPVPEVDRPAYNAKRDAEMEQMLREAGW